MHSTKLWEEQLNKTCLLFARTLDSKEVEVWAHILGELPSNAMRYAFENWQRNGRFFPKPKDILDLVDAYKLARTPAGPAHYEHHGQGYGEGDLKALWKMVSAKGIDDKRKLTEADIWGLLGEIDKKRPGGAPEFRK